MLLQMYYNKSFKKLAVVGIELGPCACLADTIPIDP
jgi:hypothetical protein